MKAHNPYDSVMDTRDAMGDLMGGRECYLLLDPEGECRGKFVGAWTGPDTAEVAVVIWGRGEHPDLAAREENTWEGEDALGCASAGAFEKIRGGLEDHYGVRLPEATWYGRSWEYPFQQAGWRVLEI